MKKHKGIKSVIVVFVLAVIVLPIVQTIIEYIGNNDIVLAVIVTATVFKWIKETKV